jgi:hypothetical protein
MAQTTKFIADFSEPLEATIEAFFEEAFVEEGESAKALYGDQMEELHTVVVDLVAERLSVFMAKLEASHAKALKAAKTPVLAKAGKTTSSGKARKQSNYDLFGKAQTEMLHDKTTAIDEVVLTTKYMFATETKTKAAYEKIRADVDLEGKEMTVLELVKAVDGFEDSYFRGAFIRKAMCWNLMDEEARAAVGAALLSHYPAPTDSGKERASSKYGKIVSLCCKIQKGDADDVQFTAVERTDVNSSKSAQAFQALPLSKTIVGTKVSLKQLLADLAGSGTEIFTKSLSRIPVCYSLMDDETRALFATIV